MPTSDTNTMPTSDTNTMPTSDTNTMPTPPVQLTGLNLKQGKRYRYAGSNVATGIIRLRNGYPVDSITSEPISEHACFIEYEETEPLPAFTTVQVGGIYKMRNGILTGTIRRPYPNSAFPYFCYVHGLTFKEDGSAGTTGISEYDIVEVVYQPFLREGWYGRFRDGRITGRLTVESSNSRHDMFRTSQGLMIFPDGRYGTGGDLVNNDIVEMIGHWDEYVHEPVEIITNGYDLPLRRGDLVMCTHRNDGVTLDINSQGLMYAGGRIIDPQTGVETCDLSEGCPPAQVTKIVVRLNESNLLGQTARELCYAIYNESINHISDYVKDSVFVHMGNNVRMPYVVPWFYRRAYHSSFGGSVKYDSQSLSGKDGDYFGIIPHFVLGDNPTIEERRLAAGLKAFQTYWTHRRDMVYNEDRITDDGVPICNVVKNVERLLFSDDVGCYGLVDMSRLSKDRIIHATYETVDTASVLYIEDGYYKRKSMRWAKLYTELRKDLGLETSDEQRRKFMEDLDRVTKNSGVEITWSSVNQTYCEPMHGYGDVDSVTGSCMEKFASGEDENYDVFDVYFNLERRGYLKMIKIFINDNYLGRAICWKPDDANGWIMDRVYCQLQRGDIPPAVISALEKFAIENNILARTYKCKVSSLTCVEPSDIHVSGLDGYEYYPYFDTYAGVSENGLHMDESDCEIVCDQSDGSYTQREIEETYEVRGRDERYTRSEITWSDYYGEYIHDEDVVTTYCGQEIHTDEAVEIGGNTDVWAHENDTIEVKIPINGRMTTIYAVEA